MSSLTGVYELDLIILLYLDVDSVISISAVDRYLNVLSYDNTVWRDVIERYLTETIIDWIPKSHSYREVYVYLNTSTITDFMDDRRIDGILYHIDNGHALPINEFFSRCSTETVYTVLSLLYDNRETMSIAVRHNRLDILKRIKEKIPMSIVEYTTSRGKHTIVKWLLKNGLYPDITSTNLAARNGNLITL